MRLSKILKPLLLINLSFATLIAHAQWNQVTDGEQLIAYVDYATVKKINTYVRVWVLYDYKVPKVIAGNTNASVKTLQEYDCKEDRSRSLSSAFYMGQMGSGIVNHTNDIPTNWSYIAPNTVDFALLKNMCKRK